VKIEKPAETDNPSKMVQRSMASILGLTRKIASEMLQRSKINPGGVFSSR
jgi:hypothetical protein